MILMIGSNAGYLKSLALALGLSTRKRRIVQSRIGLARARARLEEIDLVLIDLFWQSPRKDLISIDTALNWLQEAGYEGRIEACAYNPSASSYLSRMLKPSERPECPFRSIWDDVVDGDHPDLTVRQVAARLAPLLQS